MKHQHSLAVLLLVLATMMAAGIQAQEKAGKKNKQRTVKLYGDVADSFTKSTVSGHITLLTTDSAFVDSTSTNRWGGFSFDVPRADSTFIVKVEAKGYNTTSTAYRVVPKGRRQWFEMPRIQMKKAAGDDIYKDVALDGVVVKGTKIKMTYRGDTIVYNASAFNLPEGSMLDALVRQMPGAELKDNGDIYVNGKKIDYLMLNGSEFFKGKNKVMLDNLPYFTVKNIKVYNKQTKQSEYLKAEVEAPEYVMDVQLKREYNKGYMANAEAGAGTENRWMARLFGLYYDDYSRMSVYANANNVNESRKPGGDGDWNPQKMDRGLMATKQTGVSYTVKDKEKTMQNTTDLTLQWNDVDNETNVFSETFASQGNIMSGRMSKTRYKNFNVNLFNQANYDKLRIYSYMNIDYHNGDSWSMSADSTFADRLKNRSLARSVNDARRMQGYGFLSWSLPLSWGDYISVYTNINFGRTFFDKSYSLRNDYYAETGTDDLRNLFAAAPRTNYSYDINATYIFTLDKGWRLAAGLSYAQIMSGADSRLYRLDRLGADFGGAFGTLPEDRALLESVLDPGNSYYRWNLTRSYTPELRILKSMKQGNFTFTLRQNFSSESLRYTKQPVDTLVHRNISSFSPMLMFRTWGKNWKELRYNLERKDPSMDDMLPVRFDSDPLAVTVNNPNLDSYVRHTLSGRLNFKCDSIDLGWWIGLSGVYETGRWGTKTRYNTATGGYTFMKDNTDGNWEAGLEGGINGSFDKARRWKYSFRTGAKYMHDVDFDIAYDDAPDDMLSKVNTVNTDSRLTVDYQLNKLTVGVTGKLDSRHSRGNRANFRKIDVYDYQYGANLQYSVPWIKLDIATDINMFCRRGYQSGEMNTSDLIWNVQLSRALCKGALIVKAQAYDLLHRLSSKQYSVNAQGYTETWYNCVPRYVMFSLAYKFSKKPKKE